MQCSAVSCPAILCRTVPCCAVRCRALLCFLFRTYQTTTIANIQSCREPACPRAFYTAVLILHFPFFLNGLFFYALLIYSNSSAAVVRTSMLSFEHQSREHSKAQHSTAQSPLYKAANQVRADQRTYKKKYVRTCMLRPVCFSGAWSSWHLQVACLHLKCWTMYYMCLSFQSILPCERA